MPFTLQLSFYPIQEGLLKIGFVKKKDETSLG
jgi:hypothetical protein